MTREDLKSLAIGALVGLALLAGVLSYVDRREPAPPLAQPSVPSLIPPACDGSCMRCRPQSVKPFAVVCPYCRNRILATPSPTGDSVGEAVGATVTPKAATK
jgi:DNA-directed RNA polymerase subunit RPC12/RpoP